MDTRTARIGDWAQTASGVHFWPLDPRPEEIALSDIALHLSHLCRFGGACRKFYSVAQHSVLVSKLCPKEDALWGLLHDAAEAYIGDMVRPLKKHSTLGTHFQEVEEKILEVIADRFDLPFPIPLAVKQADGWMLAAEARDLMDDSQWASTLCKEVEALAKIPPIRPWKPRKARIEFLLWFHTLRAI